MSDPMYAQLAEQAARTADYWRRLAGMFPGDPDRVRTYELTASDYDQAERHAVLLQAVWEWADTHCRCCGDAECELGHGPCQACQVRSLLQPREEKAR